MRKKPRVSDALFPIDNAGQGLLPSPPLLPDNLNHGLHKSWSPDLSGPSLLPRALFLQVFIVVAFSQRLHARFIRKR